MHAARSRQFSVLIEQGAPRHRAIPVRFPWGEAVITDALEAGQANSYRFVRDRKGWRVLVTTRASKPTPD